jgi:hypothetical protein
VTKLFLLLIPVAFTYAQAPASDATPRAITAEGAPNRSARTTSAPGATSTLNSRVFPRILSDSTWDTTVVLFNNGAASVAFQQFFFGADGKPVSYTIHSTASSQDLTTSAIQGVLAPGSSTSLALVDASGAVREGWSLLTYGAGLGVVDGYAVIRHKGLCGGCSFETIVPVSNLQDYSMYMPFDNTQGFRSQITLVNPTSNMSTQVRLTYLSLQGQVLLIDSLTLLPAQQVTLVLPDTYPDLANKSGTVLVEADINRFSIAGVRYSDVYGAVASLPTFSRAASLPE